MDIHLEILKKEADFLVRMNELVHACVAYLVCSALIPNANEWLVPIVIFSIIVDLDHWPGVISILSGPARGKKIDPHMFNCEVLRSAAHEIPGTILLLLLIFTLGLLGVNQTLLKIAAIGIVMHFIVDFLTCQTRPLYPFSDRKVCLFFDTYRKRIISELVAFGVALIVFSIVL